MPVTLTVRLNDDGTIAVNAPLQDKLLCYGLLEAARDVIRDHRPEEPSRIAVPPAGLLIPR